MDSSIESSNIDDQLEKANILISENLLEDAKKLLRKVLIQFPDEIPIKKKLEEIQKLEIENLFRNDEKPELTNTFIKISQQTNLDINNLISDLKLNKSNNLKVIPHIFESKEVLDVYVEQIKEKLKTLDPKVRIDLSVAFITMEMPEIALEILNQTKMFSRYENEVLYLITRCNLMLENYSQVILDLKPQISDKSKDENKKIDLIYLLAIAYEKIGEIEKSKKLFNEVYNINKIYLDIAAKIK